MNHFIINCFSGMHRVCIKKLHLHIGFCEELLCRSALGRGRPMAASLATAPMLPVIVMLMLMNVALAEPILAPELRYCHLPLNLPEGEAPFDCCAPNWDRPALDFEFNESAAYNLRVRMPAHALDQDSAVKLDKAYGLMKALPSDDPRSFMQQANIHCAYCSATYQMGNSSTPLQVHGSWLFFSFHRWYLYFHERILASLLGDDSFALPFWNYDHPDGMTIPRPYMSFPNLTDVYRELSHLPPAPVMVEYFYIMNASIRTTQEQVAGNLATIYRMVVSGATTQYSFFGQPYRKDDGPQPGYGTVEIMPHNSVHGWTGDQSQIGMKDMGSLYAAARDPLLYAHHASLDRLWEIWKSFGNEDIDDSDYLNSEFVFYNEKAELVKVKVKDSFDTVKLGYVYADVENVWLNATFSRLSEGIASLSGSERECVMAEELVDSCSLVLRRDKEAALVGEEVLVIEGIEGVLDRPAHFEAFLNFPHANLQTMINCTEYAGRFSTLAQMVVTNMTGNYLNTSVQFVIGSNVRELGLDEEDTLIVTLVPRAELPYSPITIASVKLHYEVQGVSRYWREGLVRRIRSEKSFS